MLNYDTIYHQTQCCRNWGCRGCNCIA